MLFSRAALARRPQALVFVLSVCLALGLSASPGVVFAQGSPEAVASAFLDAWKAKNYQAMYDLISQESQALYSFAVFETNYTNADSATAMTDLSYVIQETQPQSTTAAVIYDLTLLSGVYSPINDNGRIMRLIQSPGGWRVAWSSMDIFDGMAGGTQLRAAGQRDPRANIYDRDGELVVEQGGTVVALYLQRQTMFNEADCLTLMAELLRRQRQDLVTLFNRFLPDAIFYVGEIDLDVYNARQQDMADTCGSVPTSERQTRHYYRGNAMSHVTGYIGQIPADNVQDWLDRGYQTGDLIGRNGVELAFEPELGGQAESLLQIVEPGGAVLRELGGTEGAPPQPIMLTIDRALQYETAQALADAYNFAEGSWGSREVSPGGAAVVIDVNTGGILAMTSFPLYEPDIFNPDTECCRPITAGERIADMLGDTRQPLFNRAVQGQFSPGSVYKIITFAAAAEEGIWGREQLFECGLTWDGTPFGDTVGFERKDWRFTDEMEAAGEITMAQALTASCNPYFWQVGAMLYRQRDAAAVANYARRMGLGQPTGLDYYGTEAAGALPVPGNASDAINQSVGQGDIQVTPLQMARLTAAIANGGTLYKPYLVQQVGGMEGTAVTFEAEPEAIGTLGFSEATMALMHEGMCAVTRDEDLGTAVWPFEATAYWACGKTGTSQTARYPNAWFVAYAPAENPQIAVAVMVEQALEGSQTAAPIARRIMDAYFSQPRWGYPGLWLDPYTPLTVPEGGTLGG